jgi:hypothetical protein
VNGTRASACRVPSRLTKSVIDLHDFHMPHAPVDQRAPGAPAGPAQVSCFFSCCPSSFHVTGEPTPSRLSHPCCLCALPESALRRTDTTAPLPQRRPSLPPVAAPAEHPPRVCARRAGPRVTWPPILHTVRHRQRGAWDSFSALRATMELQQEHPPSYDTAPLILPSPPNNELSPPPPSSINLPDLRSLGLPPAQPSHHYRPPHEWATGAQNAFANSFPAVPTTLPRASVEPSLGSPVATESIMSTEERGTKTPSVMSMDDPETRMAAEALSGLRNLGTSSVSAISGPHLEMDSGRCDTASIAERGPPAQWRWLRFWSKAMSTPGVSRNSQSSRRLWWILMLAVFIPFPLPPLCAQSR